MPGDGHDRHPGSTLFTFVSAGTGEPGRQKAEKEKGHEPARTVQQPARISSGPANRPPTVMSR